MPNWSVIYGPPILVVASVRYVFDSSTFKRTAKFLFFGHLLLSILRAIIALYQCPPFRFNACEFELAPVLTSLQRTFDTLFEE